MSDNTENKGKLEQHRLRGRNTLDVVNQLVTKYNSSNGWAVVKVNTNVLNIEVVLERSTKQSEGLSGKAVKVETVKSENTDEAKNVLVENKVGAKPTARVAKKTVATATNKEPEENKASNYPPPTP